MFPASLAALAAPALVVLGLVQPGEAEPGAGAIVVAVEPRFAAAKAGLQTGDLVFGWESAHADHTGATSGTIATPFDVEELESELALRGELTLLARRGGEGLRLTVPLGRWRLETRPWLAPEALRLHEGAAQLARAGEPELAVARWRRLAERLAGEADHVTAAWLLLAAGSAASQPGLRGAADEALAGALAAATACGEAAALLRVYEVQAEVFEERGEWDRAAAARRAGLEARRRAAPGSLREAAFLDGLGRVAAKRGDLATAAERLQRALSIKREVAPDSAGTAWTLGDLGITARLRGDLAAADGYYSAALAIQERVAPDSLKLANLLNNMGNLNAQRGDLESAQHLYERALALQQRLGNEHGIAGNLNNLGNLLKDRGDLAGAEGCYRRALALYARLGPEGLPTARILNNLAVVLHERGDLEAAEAHYRRVLALYQSLAPQESGAGRVLSDLGSLERRRGNLKAAEAHLERALAIHEATAPDSPDTAQSRTQLARVALERGDLEAAARHLHRALTDLERVAADSLFAADTLLVLGDVALARGDLADAEAWQQRSLTLRRGLLPGGARVAEACQRLALVQRQAGRPDEALASYRCALDALEFRRETLGGSDETRARFSDRHAETYREALDLLVERGRPEEAFHVLERSRARAFLLLLAERDLVFSSDVPEELDRQRRMANAEHERALLRLATETGAEQDRLRQALERVRSRQTEIEGQIRAASPRLGALQYPAPLDLVATRAALDSGTLLLSYSIGENRSWVFAVGPGPRDFEVLPVETGLPALRERVGSFRERLDQGSRLQQRRLEAESRQLGALLLGAVADRIARAERLLVLPDGPLHLVPFAALALPVSVDAHRYLVESLPIQVAASATVFAELKRRREAPRPPRLVAFGDPDYSAVTGTPPAAGVLPLDAARRRGLELSALPRSRAEIEGLGRLYPGSRALLGAEATEERAKSVGGDATMLHFACHGLADPESPLDSALALTLPREWRAGDENGLLQAWEVLEQVRIRADLVTLSACRTALGRTASGEGILGLTRSFLHAGARSVLASLWAVRDAGTADLMLRFYGHLKHGLTKDEALRAAQSELLRQPSTGHPSHWAAFQLFGDWR